MTTKLTHRGRGRPPLPPGEALSKQLMVKIGPVMKSKFAKIVGENRMAPWVRERIERFLDDIDDTVSWSSHSESKPVGPMSEYLVIELRPKIKSAFAARVGRNEMSNWVRTQIERFIHDQSGE